MAIQGPTNFRADKTTAKPSEMITLTWTAATGDFTGYVVQYSGYNGPTVGGFFQGKPDETSCTVPFAGEVNYVAGGYVRYKICAFRTATGKLDYFNEDIEEEGPVSYVEVYCEDSGEEPAPPVTGTNGKLEQFQNSAGEQIYPRTIIEGIFRQSDSKPLSEILAGLGGVTMGQVNEAIASALGPVAAALSEV